MSDTGQPEDLKSRLESFQYLYENAACGYMTVNAALLINRINTTALTWLGYAKASDIDDRSALSIIASADHAAFRQTITRLGDDPAAVSSREPFSLHLHLVGRDGATVPSLLHVSPAVRQEHSGQSKSMGYMAHIDIAIFHLGLQESLLDVLTVTRSRLENANAEVERADSRLQVIAQTTPDAIITLDAQQVVTFANPAAEAMFQLDHEKIVGEPVDQLIPTDAREIHRSHVIKFGRDGQTKRKMPGHLQVYGLRADGSNFPIDASISRYTGQGGVYYIAILRDVSERVSTEAALDQVRRKVHRYAARLRSVREDEQKRISRELHDDIGQRLAALKLDIYNCEAELKSDVVKSSKKLQAIGQQTSDIINSVRLMATRLRPKVLDELGLAPALEVYLADLSKRHGISYNLNLTENLDLSEAISTEIFRLVQEATHNIVKHANATQLDVTVQTSGTGVHLAIRDDGQGFQKQEHRPDALGLIGMQERVNSHGGHLNVESSPGQGTVVECFLPDQAADDSPANQQAGVDADQSQSP